MDLLQNRNTANTNDVLEKRFIGHILSEESQPLDQEQIKLMNSRGFSTPTFYNSRGFQVLEDHKLQYTHPTVLRFIDMKSRTSKTGAKSKKKSHTIQNKPLYGLVNNVLRRLQFEYTDKMKQMLSGNNNHTLI
jgi:hypothetical protein